MKINPELLADGGLDLARDSPENRERLSTFIAETYVPVDLTSFLPGVRMLNIDPPVLCIDDFLPAGVCDGLVSGALASARLAPSSVGAYSGPDIGIRTSSTLPLTLDVLAPGSELASHVDVVLQRAMQLLPLGLPTSCSSPGQFQRPSAAGQWVYEQPQVTRYESGQHFLTHEDAFPPAIARGKGYQRHATLLMYLNDVADGGGATRFELLGLEVAPRRGRALLFFPAFHTGQPDARTVHTAADAGGQTKFVSQMWLSRGLLSASEQQQQQQQQQQPALQGASGGGAAKGGKPARKRSKAPPAAKTGFGARK